MLVNMQRFGQKDVAADTDQVVLAWPLPGQCTMHNVWFEMDLIVNAGTPLAERAFYGVDGYLVPLLDPDGGTNIQDIWDTQIPKMSQDMSYELSDTAVTTPVYEPGEMQTGQLTQMVLTQPEKFFERRKMVSIAKTSVVISTTWYPTDNFKTHVKSNYFAPIESAILIGVSSPQMDQDASNSELLPSGATAEWAMLRYLKPVIEDMFVHILGLGSPGTGTVPYDDAEDFIEKLVSDFNEVDDPASYTLSNWDVLAFGTCQINVPGDVPSISISAE